MRKKKFRTIAVLLAAVIMTEVFTGCSAAESAPEPEVAETPVENMKEDPVEESPKAEASVDADTPSGEEASGDSIVTTGGSPWIDSDIKANLTEDMSLSAKDDFYLFVNHDWLMSNDLPEGMRAHSLLHEAAYKIEDNITAFMEDDTVKGHEAELSQTFYHALTDWDARNKTGFEPAKQRIDVITAISDIDDLTSYLCSPNKSCFVSSGINIYNDAFFDDASQYIVNIDDINRDLILSDSSEYKDRSTMGDIYYQATKELVEYMLQRAGFSKGEANAIFENAVSYEAQLAEYIPTNAEMNEPEYSQSITNLYDMDGLKKLYSAYPIEEVLGAAGYGGQEKYQVTNPDYAERLGSLYKEENLEAIKDWMLVGFCMMAMSKLDREAFEAFNRYSNTVEGSSGEIDMKYYAAVTARNYLQDALAKAYTEYYHLEDRKERIKKLCEDIIDGYERMLEEEEWLSDEMKDNAVAKLSCLDINAVYPDVWTDYDSFELTGDSLFGYYEQLNDFNTGIDASKTGRAVNKKEWNCWVIYQDPLKTYACYAPQKNAMYIYAGMAVDPVYRDDMSDEELYGHFGSMIGHEISHAFDTIGGQYDKDGNLKDWWTEADRKAFDERVEKLINYYDTITIWSGLNASGKLEQAETIADMGGIKVLLSLAKDKKGFDYETFFRSYASFHRGLITPEYEYYVVTQDGHPVDYLRCNAVVQQFQEFYDTFDVKEGDGMYLAPEDRVAVW